MMPRIEDGWWLFFHPNVVGTRQNRLVLVEDRNTIGTDRHTLKKYYSKKNYTKDGTWSHDSIWLHPLNPEHRKIKLKKDGQYKILGWYAGQAPEIQRIEPVQYPDADW